jgi:hypothetical protein
MTSKNNLLFLGVLIATLLVYCYTKKETKEGFQSKRYSVNDLVINLCPSFANEIQTAKGSTDCCIGDMIDGRCTGNTFCTKSPGTPGVPNCIDAWRNYYRTKGQTLCPSTIRNYFENILNNRAPIGCSTSAIHILGAGPTDWNAKKCFLYKTEESTKRKIDSCDVEKRRIRVQCPVVNGRSPDPNTHALWWKDASLLWGFECQYPFEPGVPLQCFDRASLMLSFDYENPGWRNDRNYHAWLEQNTCDNYLENRRKAKEAYDRMMEERRRREEAERRAREAEERARRAREESERRRRELEELRRKCRR